MNKLKIFVMLSALLISVLDSAAVRQQRITNADALNSESNQGAEEGGPNPDADELAESQEAEKDGNPDEDELSEGLKYIHPSEFFKLGQAELLVIDEAAAIPMPLVKQLIHGAAEDANKKKRRIKRQKLTLGAIMKKTGELVAPAAIFGAVDVAIGGRGAAALPPPPLPPTPPPPPPSEVTQADLMVYGGFCVSFSICAFFPQVAEGQKNSEAQTPPPLSCLNCAPLIHLLVVFVLDQGWYRPKSVSKDGYADLQGHSGENS